MSESSAQLENFSSLFDLDLVRTCYRFLEENGTFFFSRQDQSRIFERHVLESLEFIQALWTRGVVGKTVLDAGSGPGLPGMFFATLRRPPHTILLDSSQRKLGHLARALESGSIALPNVQIRFARIDEQKPCADLITARALLPYPFVLELLLPALKEQGWIALPIGSFHRSHTSHLGLTQEELVPEAWRAGERKIVLCQKIERARKGYPRGWKELKADLEAHRLEERE